MSLLDRGPHTLIVTPKVRRADKYGGTELVDGEPVPVRGGLQPVSAEEAETLGVQVDTSYRYIGRTWPGGVHTTVRVQVGPPGTTGRDFDQHGEARGYGMSPRTAHVDVILTARGTT